MGTKEKGSKVIVYDPCSVIGVGMVSLLQSHDVSIRTNATATAERFDLAIIEADWDRVGDGLRLLHALREKSDRSVLMYSTNTILSVQARALALGARGWISKHATKDYLLKCVERTLEGEYVWTTKQRTTLAGAIKYPGRCGIHFSPSEMRVAKQIALGFQNEDIANILGLSGHRVAELSRRISKKTGLNRVEQAVWMHKQGLIDEP